MIYLRRGEVEDAVAIFEHGMTSDPRPDSRDYFRTALSIGRLQQEDAPGAAELLDQVETPEVQAVATAILGGGRPAIINALSNAWLDGGALRAYRHAPNTGWRKSWAAGDATSRGVRHGLMALQGEMGYPAALTSPQWGVHDVLFGGKPLSLPQALGTYVMENILFKVSYPAEFHAQPRLMERPIVVNGDRAAIGRPPENVLAIL